MARPEKVAVVDRVTEQLNEANATLLTDYRGLTVTELAELRAELRKVDATYAVVKNTLTRLAARQAGMDGLDDFLIGPTALVFCGEDPVGPAKALKAFAQDHEDLVVKGGFLDGQVLDAEAAMKLADLASRDELLATLAGMMNNALAGFARLLAAGPSQMARLIGALEADGGVEAKGFSPTAPAAPSASDGDNDDDAAAEAADAAAEAADASSASSDSSESVDSPASSDSADEDDASPVAGAAAAATDAASDAVETATDAASEAAETATDVVEDAVDTATDAASDAVETATEAASDVAETVTEAAGEAVDAVKDAVDTATDDDSSDEEE